VATARSSPSIQYRIHHPQRCGKLFPIRDRKFRPVAWQRAFATIRGKAGRDHLQARDLRRTFVVNAARAGATVPQIAASTGHSIDHTQAIFENYLPRDVHMARAGIIKMERAK
jgi:integrase